MARESSTGPTPIALTKSHTRVGKTRGRPTKLTREMMERIVNAVKAGNYVETAVAWSGVSKENFYKWLKRGATAKSGIYADFHDALERAWAEGEVRDVAAIGAATATSWQAAAWRLERKFQKRWGRAERMEVTGRDGGPLEQKHEHVVTAESLTLARAIAGALESLAVQDDPGAGGSVEPSAGPSAP